MKRVIIVPVTETGRFPGKEILARGGRSQRLCTPGKDSCWIVKH
jgi:hypothetical protein